ncbi:ANTAR domain-containing protein [Micromonospora sp. NPDC007208]|uniref:GAF and ANTAR domain-containing protein n=1 Tax=Micromonospora sp. NPDC007208 TaxID=3364236 RepID=UPI0036A9580A
MTYNQPMQPSDAFAQLGRIKPREMSLRDMFQRVVDLAGASIPGVTEASVTVVRGTDAHTPACTGGLALTLDESQYTLGEGPCLQAARATSIESVSDMATESRWPSWTAGAVRAGARSSLSIGLPAHASGGGALNLYASDPHVFDADAVALAQAFASYATLAMANDHLNDVQVTLSQHVVAAMAGEAVIEQAKGIIMGERRCTPDQAFAGLTTMAHDTNRSIREVAQAMVERTAETAGK